MAARAKGHGGTKGKGQNPPGQVRNLKRKREAESLSALDDRVASLDAGASFSSFADLPLSQATAEGLLASHYKVLTEIQQKAIPHALRGRDILGAAKTGSGKTLAFVVPLLEILLRARWTELDGLGALVLAPTRELAIQTFEVLRRVGRQHVFSAGLVIGGKGLQEERERLGRMNILVCTPGRILQHLDQTAELDTGNLKLLILDEADRIMDLGFQSTVDAIVQHLPRDRQTLLFSATQTQRVSDLARLSLKDPEYISVHERASAATPATLQQNYVITRLPDKIDALWSFLRANVKDKILVFFSSGKQVRFVYETFRHLQPGISLLHLHGKQKQMARLSITQKFSSMQNACLLATDVVARGLDFPAVDWVIQLDCPEDADTYIHRVGRTARYERNGRAVLFLDPSEEAGMLKSLKQKKVPIEEIKIKQKKQQSIKNQLQNMCFRNPEIKYLGQKAFITYVKSIFIQKDKEIFKLDELPLEEFSASLGLPGAPHIKFQKGDNSKAIKNAPRQTVKLSDDDYDDESQTGGKQDAKRPPRAKKESVRTKYDRMFERRNQDVLSAHYASVVDSSRDADEDDEFLSIKRRLLPPPSPPPPDATTVSGGAQISPTQSVTALQHQPEAPAPPMLVDASSGSTQPFLIDSKRREKMLHSKKQMLRLRPNPTRLVFDDDGNARPAFDFQDDGGGDAGFRGESGRAAAARFIQAEARRVREADAGDRDVAREKKREKMRKRKEREQADRQMRKGNGTLEGGDGGEHDREDNEDSGIVLAPFADGEGIPENGPDGGLDPSVGGSSDGEGKFRETDKRQAGKKKNETKHAGGVHERRSGIQTVEELEAMASAYL